MKKFAYLFPFGRGIEWSSEDQKTLLKRAGNDEDRQELINFIQVSGVGSFTKLTTGEMVFRTE